MCWGPVLVGVGPFLRSHFRAVEPGAELPPAEPPAQEGPKRLLHEMQRSQNPREQRWMLNVEEEQQGEAGAGRAQ